MNTAKRFTEISQVWDFLDAIPFFGKAGAAAYEPGLEKMRKMAAEMDNPELRFPMVHVAGTNGKGSLCTAAARIYRETGLSIGVYTSPHLIWYHERFEVDGKLISDDEILLFFRKYGQSVQQLQLTYFEIATALAFWWFAQKNVNLALIETGLGGRLDATNIITPLAAVITSIDFDHTGILGDTLQEIAAEKAGIIKKGVPVLAGELPVEAYTVVKGRARELNAPFFTTNNKLAQSGYEMTFNEDAIGNLHRIWENAAAMRNPIHLKTLKMAAGLTALLNDPFPVSPSQLKNGYEKWIDGGFKGRFERLSPHKNWFFDGAHTPEAVRALKSAVQSIGGLHEAVLVLHITGERATPDLLNMFSEFGKIYYYTANTMRSADFSMIKPILPTAEPFPSERSDRQKLLRNWSSRLVIFAGSFYFYRSVKEWITLL